MNPLLDIILVEDNDALREELVSFLQRPGWAVRGVDCGEAMDAALRSRPADIALLDLNLPFEDGLGIARRLRTVFPMMGIVLLTARTQPSDRRRGYEAGADVYLTKPTSVEELESVIHNLGRRVQPVNDDALVLNPSALTLAAPGGAALRLTVTEAEMLHALALAPERQLHTEFLLYTLADKSITLTRENLAVLISRLRAKLENTLGQAEVIKAVRGVGYRLTPVVRIVHGSATGGQRVNAAAAATTTTAPG